MEVTQKEMSEMIFHRFTKYYLDTYNKRILFYNQIGDDCRMDVVNCAYDFLRSLDVFRERVPRQIIAERFENFKEARSLAKNILKDLSLIYQKN